MDVPRMMVGSIMGGLPESEPFITAAENRRNAAVVIADWMFGPENPSSVPGTNKPFWMALAGALQVDEKEARRHRCSNCVHYDNSSMTQALMAQIPQNDADVDAGYRGYCHRFDFICHDMRACQAQEERTFSDD